MDDGSKMTLPNLLINMLALVLVDYFLSGVYFGGFTSILVAALLLMVLNRLVKPVLELVSLPITCMTLGIFELFISAFIIKIIDVLMPSVYFTSFGQYILAVIIITIVNGLFGVKKD